MNDDLADEIEALNAIYDSECLVPPSSSEAEVYILQPPTSVVYPQLTLRLRIPQTYPQQPPTILDAGSVGAALADEVLKNVWREGEVCLYDLVEGLREVLGGEPEPEPEPEPELPRQATPPPPPREPTPPPAVTVDLTPRPSSPDLSSDPWIIAPPVVEKKSTFVARVIEVTDAKEAQRLINTCLADKKLAKATHNISAYRIVRENGSTIQDNDDDGETAAGSRLAHLLQVMDVQNVLVVVSRWYGGVKLGPDRFRLINTAAREALVLGGFVKEEKKSTKGKGKK